ncbi:nuclease-related domain-containing protein, partial [Haloferula sp.]|uniref:nuclease-related domain-containing protein n=1 Tax=Haloferula sp. TaxID=2497595 RepID=UPI003C72B7B7
MNPGIIPGVLLIGTGFAALLVGINRTLAAEKAKSRSPFSEKMLRPAGESLRLKLDEIRDDLMENCMILGLLLMAPGICLMVMDSDTMSGLLAWAIVAGLVLAFGWGYWKRVRVLREDLRNHRLGFEGERYVASELNVLLSQGYRVYHDFLVDWHPGGEATNFNIDHIAVGPEGVFAIETKAVRKPMHAAVGSREAYKVEFDGECLIFPSWTDERMVNQAYSTAKVLSEWLTG